MNPIKLSASLPQPAFGAMDVQKNEALVAASQGISMYDLMESAGAAVFSHIKARYLCADMLVVCGKGNNGGDGYIVARLAKLAGFNVSVVVLAKAEQITGDANKALQKLSGLTKPIFAPDIESAAKLINQFKGELILDCIFGIGFKGELTQNYKTVIKAINQYLADVVSVDVPSGLNADTGFITSVCVLAKATISFIVLKKGLLTGQAANAIGELYLAELNVGTAFIAQHQSNIYVQGQLNLPLLSKRHKSAHKGDIGLALAIGGNEGMPGAIKLTSEAALRCGASLLATCCHPKNQSMIVNGRPEIMLAPADIDQLINSRFLKKAKAIAIGPGLGRDSWGQQLYDFVISCDLPLILDADGLYFLSKNPVKKSNWVLTPHPGEAALLLGTSVEEIESDRFAAVTAIQQKYGGVCLLKGAGTLISDGRQIWINTSGNPGMASGGMGDVLTGIILAMILQLPDLMSATRLAAFIHGQAADIIAAKNGERGMLASDLFAELQHLVNSVS